MMLSFASLLIVAMVSSMAIEDTEDTDHQVRKCVKIILKYHPVVDMESSEVDQFVDEFLNPPDREDASFNSVQKTERSRKRRSSMKELKKWAKQTKKQLRGRFKRQDAEETGHFTSEELDQLVDEYLNPPVGKDVTFNSVRKTERSRTRRSSMKELKKWAKQTKKQLRGRFKRQTGYITPEEVDFLISMPETAKVACVNVLVALENSPPEPDEAEI